jgi:hypothetical protein
MILIFRLLSSFTLLLLLLVASDSFGPPAAVAAATEQDGTGGVPEAIMPSKDKDTSRRILKGTKPVSAPAPTMPVAPVHKKGKNKPTMPVILTCPTTQTSSGMTTTVFVVDVANGKHVNTAFGTFDRFSTPDEIIITYEGNVVFNPGALSGSGIFLFGFGSGASTLVEVTIIAPIPDPDGWSVTVQCGSLTG